MALTKEQEAYYKKCKHELDRAKFFGNVPQYEDMMQAEVDRLEGEDATYPTVVTKEIIDTYHEANPYGEKKGSPVKQLTFAAVAI